MQYLRINIHDIVCEHIVALAQLGNQFDIAEVP